MSKTNPLILVIDDNRINNYICEKIIKEYSELINVETYLDSEKGLEAILEYKNGISFLILDIFMPICNGWDIMNRMIKDDITIPILILTSSINEEDKIKAASYPFVVDYIEKPATVEIINIVLEKYKIGIS